MSRSFQKKARDSNIRETLRKIGTFTNDQDDRASMIFQVQKKAQGRRREGKQRISYPKEAAPLDFSQQLEAQGTLPYACPQYEPSSAPSIAKCSDGILNLLRVFLEDALCFLCAES